ncbi:MAG: response regulator [Candidatus Glassbacteria bacterium]|nr:response regulator [Candidatus Glassbacteria bacterium]
MNMELIRDVLELAGFELLCAIEAASALEIAAERLPDVILMDFQLPGMNGLEATRRLKANPVTAGIPVVAVTSHAMKGEREAATEAGCAAYFPKPLDVTTFAAEVKKLLV